MLARGIIKESTSPYCSRIVPVRKKNGNMRLCVDLRPLNSRVVKQQYPFPIIEDLFSRMANCFVLTHLDIKESFHAIGIHPDFTKYFSFATPDGQFEYLKLPFGYSESPAEFQKRLLQILKPLVRADKVLVYIDDILIPSSNIEENLDTLSQVLLLLKRYSFDVNYDKCQFLKKKIEFLGYIVSNKGITLSDRHVNAVNKFPVPRNIHEVQRFLGLASYFRKFVPAFAEKAKPLYTLLKKNVAFSFDENCVKSFNLLKQLLTTAPVLSLYNPSLETELHTDASSVAFAAILLQKQESKSWAPVAYFSQTTNEAESRYHSYELEMLAIVKSVERFRIYLYGLKFTIVSDCHAVVYAVNKANINPRVARWILRLQGYKFKLIHRKGEKMLHVDALSRIVGSVETVPLEQQLHCRQLTDPSVRTIAEHLEASPHDHFEMIEGLIYRKDDNSLRFWVPESMVPNIIRNYHDQSAHCALEKTLKGICDTYWFPSMRKKVQSHIDNCLVCIVANSSSNSKEGEIQLDSVTSIPMEVMHIDHFGPLTESTDGFKHILVAIDAFTRFTWLWPCKSTSSRDAISHLTPIFDTFGNPSTLVSDRGTAFSSFEFTEFLQKRSIKHRLVAVAAPWANGLVERVNRYLKSSLRKMVDDHSNWSNSLPELQYIINNTFHSSIKNTPSKLLLGYDKRNHSDFPLIKFLKNLADATWSTHLQEDRAQFQEIAIQATNRLKDYNKIYYDKRHKTPSEYKIGDYVMIRDTTVKPGEDRKLKHSYKGPYLVTKVLNKNRYVIQDIPGCQITQKPYDSILSPDRLKRWLKSPSS